MTNIKNRKQLNLKININTYEQTDLDVSINSKYSIRSLSVVSWSVIDGDSQKRVTLAFAPITRWLTQHYIHTYIRYFSYVSEHKLMILWNSPSVLHYYIASFRFVIIVSLALFVILISNGDGNLPQSGLRSDLLISFERGSGRDTIARHKLYSNLDQIQIAVQHANGEVFFRNPQ